MISHIKAKPSDFPQINQEEHYKFLKVKSLDTKCIECHSPHEPIFLLTEVKQSRLHPIVYKCTDCHEKKPAKDFNEVENHPKIFVCKDCHSEIVKSFEEKPHHNYVDCRTCHLFHRENDNVGRMYKNGNAKFCLLCHEKKDFKDGLYPPKVEWPNHLGNLKFLVNIDQKICLECHSNQIHIMDLKSNPNPHPNNWKFEHKKYVNKKSDIKQVYACGFCHTKNDCYSCHQLDMPHPDEFVQGGHKELVDKRGKQFCFRCHNQDFCSQCH
ncbi:MAG: hypothetical protein HZB41_13470 [Ignavibacteriae bacterium]|nr:hypothetical protein [Ignavibacteriota bacterium]